MARQHDGDRGPLKTQRFECLYLCLRRVIPPTPHHSSAPVRQSTDAIDEHPILTVIYDDEGIVLSEIRVDWRAASTLAQELASHIPSISFPQREGVKPRCLFFTTDV